MVMRLRRTRRTGLTVLVIAIALIGSAWLAYASPTPQGASYPVTAAKIKAKGNINDCVPAGKKQKCTAFSASVTRKSTGKVSGSLKVTVASTKTSYSFKSPAVTSCGSNVAVLDGTGGKGSGKANKGKTFSSHTTINNNGTPTFDTVITDSSNAVIYTTSGPQPVTGKFKISISC